MPIQVRARDGSIQTFPDGTSADVIHHAMTAYDNRGLWGGLARKVGDAVGQVADAWKEGQRIQGESAIRTARGSDPGFLEDVIQAPGKIAGAARISTEEKKKWEAASQAAGRGHAIDNEYDAQRHAEWSSRLARELGPGYARFITGLWEIIGARDTPAAHAMDRYNNGVGIGSAEVGRPYNIDNLQLAPGARPKSPWVNPSQVPRRR